MNQFGVVITIEKNDGPVSDNDKVNIREDLSDIMYERRYADFRRTGLYKTLHVEDEQRVSSRLVEYKTDEYAEEFKEIAEDEELPLAEDIAHELQHLLGEGFRVSASIEDL